MTPEQIERDAIERAVDVIRIAIQQMAIAHTHRALIQALSYPLRQSAAGAALSRIDSTDDEAWNTIRPALRKLVAEIKAQQGSTR